MNILILGWVISLAIQPSSDVSEVIRMFGGITYRIGGQDVPGGYDKSPEVGPVASAIAAAADGSLTGDVSLDEALMVVYAAYESALRPCAVGDGGKSLGVWQLQGVARAIACDPQRAAAHWFAAARASSALCGALPEEERLAALASGDCQHARRLVRERYALARRLVGSANE